MKKIVLSAMAAMTLGTVAANAVDLYQDANGQVFTQAGEGRTLIKDNSVDVFSHADKLKFSGQTYIGYKYTDYADAIQPYNQDFEIRRGYFQLKAYLLDDPKSYYRVTLDLTREGATSATTNGSMVVRAKYAYLNLHEVLPATSLEIGLAHRPWHDYEEHNSWLYRSISEILIENKNSAHLSSSADFGVMAKTRTKYFDADYGIFNGEGYHSAQFSNGMSLEWRFTGHLLGTKGHPEKNTYLDASFFGQINKKHSKNATTGNKDDLKFYGFHAVYNMPSFLVSGQYVTSTDTSSDSSATGEVSAGSGSGYAFNVEGRLGDEHQYKAFARLDKWTPDVVSGATKYARNTYIVGAAWKMNKNVEWVANVTIDDNEHSSTSPDPKSTAYMLTTEINF